MHIYNIIDSLLHVYASLNIVAKVYKHIYVYMYIYMYIFVCMPVHKNYSYGLYASRHP